MYDQLGSYSVNAGIVGCTSTLMAYCLAVQAVATSS